MALSFLNTALPYFNRMHEMTVEHTHEEIQLLAIDFSTMLFETTAPMPAWRDAYLARDQRPTYAYLLQGAQGAAVAPGRHPLGAQDAPAPRAVPGARRHLPRRHLRRHPPRPGLGHGVHGHDDRLHGPAHPRPGRRRGHGRATGRTGSSGCCAAAPTSATSCRPTGPSTCTSTSSWPTTWPWWRGSTTWPASPSTTAPGRPWPPSWRRTPGPHGPSLRPGQFGWTPPSGDGLAFYTDASG